MKKKLVIGDALPNIPWEEKPANHDRVLWRYSQNPVIPRDLIPSSNSIFNSAVVPFEDGLLVFSAPIPAAGKCRSMQARAKMASIGN